MHTLAERCRHIELLVLDVDGVLTDGSITYAGDSQEIKAFHVRDGSGIKLWNSLGKHSAIITGRASSIVNRRAAELKIAHVVQGVDDKLAALKQIWVATGIRSEQTAVIGDDLPDLPMLRSAGLSATVSDGCREAKTCAHFVTLAHGGRGAVRELVELILKCQGKWHGAVEAAG